MKGEEIKRIEKKIMEALDEKEDISLNLDETDFLRYFAEKIRKRKDYIAMHSAEPYSEGGYAEYKKNDKIVDILYENDEFDINEFDDICKKFCCVHIELDGEDYYIYLK